jgi:hypothetical protein
MAKNPLTGLYVLVGVLFVGIVLVLGLYFGSVGIFGEPYKFIDPRTGQPSEPGSWKEPVIDYSPYTGNEPTHEIQQLMTNLTNALDQSS